MGYVVQCNQKKYSASKLYTEDLYENNEFVIVKVTRIVEGEEYISIEKGIKDDSGDIVDFKKI